MSSGLMDSSSNWRNKLTQFRIKELKDVLTQLGLAKQGKKQDLLNRILSLLSDEQGSRVHGWGKKNSISKEGIVKIIDDTFRKMQTHGATDLASRSQGNSDFNNANAKEVVVDSYQHDIKIRCPCGIASDAYSLVKCEGTRCPVWQHIDCVIIPEKHVDGVQPEIPPRFHCEKCRIYLADPFWVTLAHPLHPIKLSSSSPAPDGTMNVQSTEKTFQLTRADRELLQKNDYDLQVWCILLNDKVPFRMQWPQYIDLQVNGVSVRTISRPGSQLLGINGRDDSPVITTCSREGLNKICLSMADARVFCFGIRIARRRTLQQVLSLVPKESDGESFEEALARVRRCIGGSTERSADSDSDLEVVADSVSVTLRCPMSGIRMKIAGRFKPCAHMACFDLETFIELNQRSRKWQCPTCLKNYTLESIIIDPYFNCITSLLKDCGEDTNEIDIKPDGCWRVKNEGEYKDLGRWHLPDGSLCTNVNVEMEPVLNILKQVKQEGASDGQTSLKFRENHNGSWEIRKPDDRKAPCSGNHIPEKLGTHILKMPRSNSATGSEDPSVNQDGGQPFDFSLNNGHEFDSSLFSPTYNTGHITSHTTKDADIIVLTDSEEENVTLVSPGVVYSKHHADNAEVPFPTPMMTESYPEDHGIGSSRISCPGFLGNGDDYTDSLWPIPTRSNCGFNFFHSDLDVPDALGNEQTNSLVCPSTNGYGLTPNSDRGDTFFIEGIQPHSNTEVNGSLVDNPLAFGSDDPSLKIFLPTRPADVSLSVGMNEHVDTLHEVRTDDWISLRLGGTGVCNGETLTTNGLDSRHHFPSRKNETGSLADTASLILSMNDDESSRATPNGSLTGKRSDGPFLHPRQPRSVRPRSFLSINLDSD